MSLIAGLHLGNFALIAADKREMSIHGDLLVPAHDEAEKIINAGLGYVTGSGIVELLHPVKDALTNTEITHTDQILAIIAKERGRFRTAHSTDSEWAEEQIKKTGWLFTYMTEADGQAMVRVAMVHGAWNGDAIRLLYKGAAKVLVPIDGTAEETQRLSDILAQNLKTTDELTDFSESIGYHIPLLQEVFKYSSEICGSVSEIFHVAVHTNDGKMLVSKEISAGTTNVQFER